MKVKVKAQVKVLYDNYVQWYFMQIIRHTRFGVLFKYKLVMSIANPLQFKNKIVSL